ncbi:toxin-antitoxin system HicB family antitoxin [Enterobacter roggenkampii]
MHKAEEYTVSVRFETIEDENFFVGRVAELPDVEEYADTAAEAFALVLDTVRTTQKVYAEEGREFPIPLTFDNASSTASGRVTLRLRRSTHHKAVLYAESEGVSLNSYLSSLIESNIALAGLKEVDNKLNFVQTHIQRLSALVEKISSNSDMHLTIFSTLFKQNSFSMRSKVDFLLSEDDEYEFQHQSPFGRLNLSYMQGVKNVNC